jgi:hypothetical protein
LLGLSTNQRSDVIPPIRLYDRSDVCSSDTITQPDDWGGMCTSLTVHLACHGVITDDPLYESALKLGRDISMTEVLRRGVASGSAFVLSACSVGGIVPSYPSELLGFLGPLY